MIYQFLEVSQVSFLSESRNRHQNQKGQDYECDGGGGVEGEQFLQSWLKLFFWNGVFALSENLSWRLFITARDLSTGSNEAKFEKKSFNLIKGMVHLIAIWWCGFTNVMNNGLSQPYDLWATGSYRWLCPSGAQLITDQWSGQNMTCHALTLPPKRFQQPFACWVIGGLIAESKLWPNFTCQEFSRRLKLGTFVATNGNVMNM